MKILVIDDSIDLNRAISKHLYAAGFEVENAYDGSKGLRMALENVYDVILLDVMLPQMTGYNVLKMLRKEGRTTPVILVTAKNEISDKIEGLELGADDYLQKPFNTDELLARIRALARRSHIPDYESDTIKYGDLTLTLSSKKLAKDSMQIKLKENECEIIQYMIKNSSVILAEQKIAEVCTFSEKEKISKYIDDLTKILEYIYSDVKIIYIKGVGYKLCC